MAERRIPEIVIEPPLPGRATSLHACARAEYPALVEATVQRLREAAADHPGRIVQATSLGAEDMVLTDLIARHGTSRWRANETAPTPLVSAANSKSVPTAR